MSHVSYKNHPNCSVHVLTCFNLCNDGKFPTCVSLLTLCECCVVLVLLLLLLCCVSPSLSWDTWGPFMSLYHQSASELSIRWRQWSLTLRSHQDFLLCLPSLPVVLSGGGASSWSADLTPEVRGQRSSRLQVVSVIDLWTVDVLTWCNMFYFVTFDQ